MAVDMIYAWLKDDVYGFVEQQRVNMEQDNNIKEDIISRL
jgi:hypothetical protein